MKDGFRDTLSDCNLMDLGFQGPIFTWSNNRTAPHTVRCLLDRFYGNREWLEFALFAVLEHLNFPGSDHVPILLCVSPRSGIRVGSKGRPWRFNAHWIRKEECEAIIREGWESAVSPYCFERLFSGLEACQLGLCQWSQDIHNNPRRRIDQLKQQLSTCHLVSRPSRGATSRIRKCVF